MDIVHVTKMCATECDRQGATSIASVIGLLEAYRIAMERAHEAPTIVDIFDLAFEIDRVANPFPSFRQIPVTFANGTEATTWDAIPEAMLRLCMFAKAVYNERERHPEGVTEWIRAFLNIHPFKDGNGRVAFILYNWFHQTLNAPRFFPDFYAIKETGWEGIENLDAEHDLLDKAFGVRHFDAEYAMDKWFQADD